MRCRSKTKLGKRCKNNTINDNKCRMHGGGGHGSTLPTETEQSQNKKLRTVYGLKLKAEKQGRYFLTHAQNWYPTEPVINQDIITRTKNEPPKPQRMVLNLHN